ncbi:MAG: hypothetical protein QM765_41055 [Myxococcales bacterium]
MASVSGMNEDEVLKFRKRKAAATLIISSWVLGMFVLFAASYFELQLPPWAYHVFMGYLVVAGIALFLFARCPRCRAYQPNLLTSRFCSKCGVAFAGIEDV